MKPQPLVILGGRYTARWLLSLASSRYRTVRLSSRRPKQNLCDLPPDQCIEFDLLQRQTWANVPHHADVVWCFPALPIDVVREFAATLSPFGRLVVLGSTSAYDISGEQTYPPPWTDETASIDMKKPRAQGEEFLRIEQGAIVLRVAGIYGPGRNPLDWIKKGLIGPSRKYVNLIHVVDLAGICLSALKLGRAGEIYNVSDGTPRTWEEICRVAHERWNVTSPAETVTQESGKRIDIRKLREELRPQFRHPDLFTALEEIIGGRQ